MTEEFTIQCQSCGTLYNDLQEVCPYCGEPQPTLTEQPLLPDEHLTNARLDEDVLTDYEDPALDDVYPDHSIESSLYEDSYLSAEELPLDEYLPEHEYLPQDNLLVDDDIFAIVGEDGETQIRIVPGGDIDEFKIDLEGSTVAFKGTFKVLNTIEAAEHLADHESKEHHDTEMAHTAAEKADYFVEALDFKEITQ